MNKVNSLKKITLKRILITLGGLLGLAALGAVCFVLYFIIPSGFQSRHAEGPGVLTELLKMADKSKPFNPDRYISSTYRPGDPLYKPVLNIQRKRWDLAEKQLQPLVKQNNADAMFWLAEITYGGYYDSSQAAELYQQSAKLGNPYAALKLDDDSYICQQFMGYYCNKKWGKLGRELLQERADKGDLKAAFYLIQIDINEFSDSAIVHEQLEKLATANAKNHQYQPLLFLIDSYLSNNYHTLLNKNNVISKEQQTVVMKLILLAANDNFPPAMSLYIYEARDLLPDVYQKSVGYLPDLANQLMHLYLNKYLYSQYYFRHNQSRAEVVRGASYAYADDIINNKIGASDDNFGMYQFLLRRKKMKPLTDEEVAQAREQSKSIIKDLTPVIYIDEMNPKPRP